MRIPKLKNFRLNIFTPLGGSPEPKSDLKSKIGFQQVFGYGLESAVWNFNYSISKTMGGVLFYTFLPFWGPEPKNRTPAQIFFKDFIVKDGIFNSEFKEIQISSGGLWQ